MIVNLMENSIQHTSPGTKISVELGQDELGVYAVIADTGPGVPAWASEKIFRRFFRLDESRGSRGNGLGLSLVAAIAKHHGIALTVSDNGPGLRTVLRFPEDDRADESRWLRSLQVWVCSRAKRVSEWAAMTPSTLPNRKVREKLQKRRMW